MGSNSDQPYSYDAFGLRRDATGWADDADYSQLDADETIARGYTGHEHLDNVRAIHMNGRVQDPIIGRFMSVDPMAGEAGSQTYNGFSYVGNNPLSFTDPTGFDRFSSMYDTRAYLLLDMALEDALFYFFQEVDKEVGEFFACHNSGGDLNLCAGGISIEASLVSPIVRASSAKLRYEVRLQERQRQYDQAFDNFLAEQRMDRVAARKSQGGQSLGDTPADRIRTAVGMADQLGINLPSDFFWVDALDSYGALDEQGRPQFLDDASVPAGWTPVFAASPLNGNHTIFFKGSADAFSGYQYIETSPGVTQLRQVNFSPSEQAVYVLGHESARLNGIENHERANGVGFQAVETLRRGP